MALNPARYSRRHLLQRQVETTYGVTPAAWQLADAILLTGMPRHRIERDLVDRNLSRPYLGGSDQLLASKRTVIEFSVELAGSGAAGTPPGIGPLLRACGLAETIVPSGGFARVEYMPVSSGFESLTLRYLVDGIGYLCRGARGTATINLMAYDRPTVDFTFWGYDTGAIEVNLPGSDYSAFQEPQVVNDANAGNIRLGSSIANGLLTGGTTLVSRGISLDLGLNLTHTKMLGDEGIDYDGRETTGSMTVGLTPAQEFAWREDINAGTKTSLSFFHGTAAGKYITLHAPRVQRVAPQIADLNGRALMDTELRFLPVTGNDEFRLVFS